MASTTDIQRTFGTPTNAKIYTFSIWIKKCETLLTSSINWICAAPGQFGLNFRTGNDIDWHEYTGGYKYRILTNRLFRDPAAWYHLCFTFDSTESVAGDRCKIYVNGVEETSFSTETQPTLNYDSVMNSAVLHAIGSQEGEGYANYGNGILLSHVNFVDGTAYPASTFGETDSDTGEWKIKTSPSVTYGDNGFFIFKDNASVTDQSGEGNNWTASNGTLTPTEDCPSDVFNTLNPNYQSTFHATSRAILANGNTKWTGTSDDTSQNGILSTLGASKGKFYLEAKFVGTYDATIGVAKDDFGMMTAGTGGLQTAGWYGMNTNLSATGGAGMAWWSNNSATGDRGSTISTGNIIMMAIDIDNNKLYFGLNGTWEESGDPTSGATGTGATSTLASDTTYLVTCANYGYNNANSFEFNFGNGYFGTTAITSEGTNASNIGKFEYDVPTGYTALSLKGINS